jgi:hypothetical protein
VDWSANPLSRNAQPPSQSSWSSSTRFTVKRAVIEFWSFSFSRMILALSVRKFPFRERTPTWA